MSQAETPALSIHELSVRYGRSEVVDRISLTVPRNAVYALLGRNGAGKSSLVRCAIGQQRATSGRVEMFGMDVWRHRASLMERVGIVAEEGDAPAEMRVGRLADFCARLCSRWDRAAFDERLKRFGIAQKPRFGDLSKGQKKQVSLALALAASPEFLILDDPTLGLDAVARKSLFEELIAELADRGTTVFLTTHDLAGIESIADRVGVISGGRLVLDEDLELLKARFRRIRFASRPVALESRFDTAAVRPWGGGTEAIVTNFAGSHAEIAETAEIVPMSLEEIFIAVAGEGAAA